ncbi:hypothetical protein BX616_000555 [Lobosporangium transversale]|nr:hypothetical protein BX616_000555 [Lobosporangium transversale]
MAAVGSTAAAAPVTVSIQAILGTTLIPITSVKAILIDQTLSSPGRTPSANISISHGDEAEDNQGKREALDFHSGKEVWMSGRTLGGSVKGYCGSS